MVAKPNKKKINAMLAELGIELKPEDFAPGKAPKEEFKNTMPGRRYSKEQEEIQAEAVLLSLVKLPKDWILHKCKYCGESFYANYYYIAYCGDQCRALHLKKFGIEWTNHFNEPAKWSGMTPPMVIPPEALKAMKYLVERAEQGTHRSEQMKEQIEGPSVLFEPQTPPHSERPIENVNVPTLPDKKLETPVETIESQSEDDFLELLSALDV